MKHAVIIGHPDPRSFNFTLARAYCDAIRAKGHEPVLRDLYRMNFDPVLRDDEMPRASGFCARADVLAERRLLEDADVFAFIYPFWFNAPPAIVKGYVDRVFGMGFGYGPIQAGGNEPLLTGRSMISFTSSGAPKEWVQEQGTLAALRHLFDDHVAEICGFHVLNHVHFGAIVPNLAPHAVEDAILRVKQAVARHF